MPPPRRRPPRNQTNAGRAVLYVRVSSVRGREGDEFHSPALQIDGMRRALTRTELREVAVIDDDIDVSGRSFERPGLARIRAMVEAGQVDVVAVNTLSRVGRNLSESLTFIKWLRSHGVAIVSATEPVDDTPEGDFMLATWLNIAQLQADQIGASWSRVIERRARDGKPHARPPVGYRKLDGQLVEDPVLGPAVRAAFLGYAAGEPVRDLAWTLADVRGQTQRKAGFKRILRNPVYRGLVVVESATGGRIRVPGKHPALVDEATWARVERRMAAETAVPPRHLAPAYSLTGLLLCGGCGQSVQVWPMKARGVPQLRARCQRKVEGGAMACPGVGTPLYERLEAEVLRRTAEYAQHLKGNTGARRQQRARAARASADVPALERELAKTRDAMARLTERWARQRMPEAAFDVAMARLAEAEANQLRMLDAARVVSEAPPPAKVVALVEKMLELWPDMTNAEKNRALRAVVASVTLRKAAYYREPEEDRIVAFTPRW